MKLQFSRTIRINKPAAEIYSVIGDISKWNVWSPWIHCEPTAKTQHQGQAGQVQQMQEWEGEVIGSGKMVITELVAAKSVKMSIEFLKPWKSIAEVLFDLHAIDDKQTEVVWNMNSNLPFFMFFFKKMMTAYMSSDFDRGLRMLKEYLDTGAVVSKSIFQGEKDFSGFKIIGKKSTCNIAYISKAIPADFNYLHKLVNENKLPKPDSVICLNHKFDIPNGICIYTAGHAYNLDRKIEVPQGLELLEIPPHKGLLIDYYGPYRNISNGWGMASSYFRSKKKKASKQIPMYEHYKAMPDGRPENEIYTQIIIPFRD